MKILPSLAKEGDVTKYASRYLRSWKDFASILLGSMNVPLCKRRFLRVWAGKKQVDDHTPVELTPLMLPVFGVWASRPWAGDKDKRSPLSLIHWQRRTWRRIFAECRLRCAPWSGPGKTETSATVEPVRDTESQGGTQYHSHSMVSV